MTEIELPLLIASGILIATFIRFILRTALSLWANGHQGMSVLVATPAVLVGGGLIFAGLGIVAW